jgi:hypothetical protein
MGPVSRIRRLPGALHLAVVRREPWASAHGIGSIKSIWLSRLRASPARLQFSSAPHTFSSRHIVSSGCRLCACYPEVNHMPTKNQFRRHTLSNGIRRSICILCAGCAGSSNVDADLDTAERGHVCDLLTLRQAETFGYEFNWAQRRVRTLQKPAP